MKNSIILVNQNVVLEIIYIHYNNNIIVERIYMINTEKEIKKLYKDAIYCHLRRGGYTIKKAKKKAEKISKGIVI